MEAFFKLDNSILDYGLTPNELKIAVRRSSGRLIEGCLVKVKFSSLRIKPARQEVVS